MNTSRSRRSLTLAIALCLTPATAGLHLRDNVAIFEDLARRGADSLIASISTGDTLCIDILGPEGTSWILEGALLHAAHRRHISVARCSSPNSRVTLRVLIVRGRVAYLPVESPDSVQRDVLLEVDGRLSHSVSDGVATLQQSRLLLTERDTIARADSSIAQKGVSPFETPPMPTPASGGFWENIVEPAIVVGAAVVATILLFTVRSR